MNSLILTVALILGAETKPIEWKGAVDAFDAKAGTFAMLVVGKGLPEDGKVIKLKVTLATKFVWRTEDPKKFDDAKPEDVTKGQHIHILKNEKDELLEIRLPAKKIKK